MVNNSVLGAFFIYITLASAETTITSAERIENLQSLCIANNEFAFNLHRTLVSGSSRNVFFSPLSISTAFGMLLYGTRGETARELRTVMGYEKGYFSNDLFYDAFNSYLSDPLKDSGSSEGYVLSSVNAILVDKHLHVLEEYIRTIQKLYKATVRDVDFACPTTVKEINAWGRKKTNDKIKKLLDELSPETLLVLLSAVYFKGDWKIQFDEKETRDAIFFNNGLKAKMVPFMQMESEFPVGFFDDFRVLEMPYVRGNVSMLILLPNDRDGLQALEESLNFEKLAEIRERLQPLKVYLSLPKFKMEFEEELSVPMQALGAKQIFTPGADLSGMTPSKGVSVNQILHKAVIEVNEKGSEATAVTEVIVFKSGRFPFTVEHPFLFVIIGKSNLVLFMGRVTSL